MTVLTLVTMTLVVLAAEANSPRDVDEKLAADDKEWQEYKQRYDKQYKPSEDVVRLQYTEYRHKLRAGVRHTVHSLYGCDSGEHLLCRSLTKRHNHRQASSTKLSPN